MRKNFKKAIALLVPLVFISGISYSSSKEEESIVSEGEIQIEAGKKQIQNVVVSTPSGEQISFPLAIVKGESPGPTLGIIAGADGGEYCGVEAAIRIYSLLEPSKLKGEVRIVPCANIPGFMSRTMFVVQQDGKPIRCPGKSNGSYSERLAALIYREVVEPSECVVELSCGELTQIMAHRVTVYDTTDKKYNEKVKKIADIFGARNILIEKLRSAANKLGSASSSAAFSGKLSIRAYAGGHGLRIKEDVDFLSSGILNIAGYFNMIDHMPTPSAKIIYLDSFFDVRSPSEGIFDCMVMVDAEVTKDTKLGVIHNFGGDIISEVFAPEGGVVLGIVTAAGVREGSVLIAIGPRFK